jgi:hypothetical protein
MKKKDNHADERKADYTRIYSELNNIPTETFLTKGVKEKEDPLGDAISKFADEENVKVLLEGDKLVVTIKDKDYAVGNYSTIVGSIHYLYNVKGDDCYEEFQTTDEVVTYLKTK